MIRYVSTRGPGEPGSFLDAVMAGLAPDGGLYVPDLWPEIDRAMLGHMAGAPYTVIAGNIMRPFVEGAVSPAMLQDLLVGTYDSGAFNHRAVAPLIQIGPNAWILELFHGPTLSFKDYAMQFIGRLFDHLLEKQRRTITIIGATSGDTGSAAIEACKGCKNITTFILHPHNRTSEVQRRQMTTVQADNIHNIALEGTFDDCQALVKAMLSDAKLQKDLRLSAVNSINWARIMAQTVYYFAAAIALGAPDRPVSFTVPTGNFGNVYAGWAARQMGLPIDRLIVASNRNDILTRFFETGEMRADKVMPSISPSMDIQVSSNFERYLYNLTGQDGRKVARLMDDFRKNKSFRVDAALHKAALRDFSAERCSDSDTIMMMRDCYESTGVIIDPHTAVGLHAANKELQDPTMPSIVLACAHPAKFPDAVEEATGIRPVLPPHLSDLMEREESFAVLPNDLETVINHISSRVQKS